MIWPLILLATLVTACISGIFGMAGGLILMGVLVLLLPVSAAMVTHGAIQSVSNGWRALLWRDFIYWRVLAIYLAGSLAAFLILIGLAFELSKPWLYIILGLVPALIWIPRRRLALDARKPIHAVICGFAVTGLNIIAGVSGPLLDIFFIADGMDRRSIVATKAATQVAAHAAKIAFYIMPALAAGSLSQWPWLLAAAPLAIIGTTLGARVLKLISDADFRKYTKWIVTGVGMIYVVRGVLLLS
ncbi:sulfite exporter TauE/SafE family protein [Hyphobacterium sp. HN65]|uniref:Probable membrane transporter protein n=1 Tax=Hyphobacterium lacteum TaxID=3116575 RepID=A0ABU7LN65_9PROT|nr:sulfite exporter TauE/SafE family protein [Hyphobacterium sp. HN65]MEE2525360.1 sulfite exporter TauE/SafE family protein [Hyphobacterium sp. HN65]